MTDTAFSSLVLQWEKKKDELQLGFDVFMVIFGELKIILRKNIGIGIYEQCFSSLFNEHKFIELTWQVKWIYSFIITEFH